jgi:hypothetical protein
VKAIEAWRKKTENNSLIEWEAPSTLPRENKMDLLEAAPGYRARNERIRLVVSEGMPLTARDS